MNEALLSLIMAKKLCWDLGPTPVQYFMDNGNTLWRAKFLNIWPEATTVGADADGDGLLAYLQ